MIDSKNDIVPNEEWENVSEHAVDVMNQSVEVINSMGGEVHRELERTTMSVNNQVCKSLEINDGIDKLQKKIEFLTKVSIIGFVATFSLLIIRLF